MKMVAADNTQTTVDIYT